MRQWQLDNRYTQLPAACFADQAPTPVSAPSWLSFNAPLAASLGLPEQSRDMLAVLAGNRLPDGARPIAMAYAGHQFGQLVGQLGDGRALLLGEQLDGAGQHWDIQLKGAGRTPFSRGGDGRAALGPVLREYLLSEAMHALGVPTTRALAAVRTGDLVQRETPQPGAILTRVASSHLRVGTFQYLAIRGETGALRQLVDYALSIHYPDADSHLPAGLALLDGVIEAQARLVAHWMSLGFIHGVMNTDNCSIGGDTIDYGPCAFIDTFDPAKRFSFIDRQGRYAWQNQPAVATWNLARLAECLLPLIDDDEQRAIALASARLEAFETQYRSAWLHHMRQRLALDHAPGREEDDHRLITDLLSGMHAEQADFQQTFLRLREDSLQEDHLPALPAGLRDWRASWLRRLALSRDTQADQMAQLRANNPRYLPRNHLVQEALGAAEQGDMAPFERLLAVCTSPYDDHPGEASLCQPPTPEQRIAATYCGT